MTRKNIQYIDNQIALGNLSSAEQNDIQNLWIKIREDYMDWVSESRLIKVKGRPLVRLFMWKGMSTWWLNKLTHKDSFVNNRWLNRLFVVHYCRSSLNDITLYTDDHILIKTIYKNKIDVRIIFASNKFQLLVNKSKIYIINIATLIKSFFLNFRKILILREYKGRVWLTEKPVIWFKTLFPTGTLSLSVDNNAIDRIYANTPLYDKDNGYRSIYMIYIVNLFHKNLGKIKDDIKSLIKQSDRDVVFPESCLSFQDIVAVFSSTIAEQFKFYKLTKDKEFLSIFMIDDLDVSSILIDEWSSSYWGFLQDAKLHGVASSKFFGQLNDNQIVVTYGEFFSRNRAEYCLTKKTKPKICFISIQHASASKNKMFTYHRSSEFSNLRNNCGVESMPSPDYFFVQGMQYRKILEEFYDSSRIKLVGSLSLEYKSIISNANPILDKIQKEKLQGKRFILIATSIDDYVVIFNYIEKLKVSNNWEILLTAHPSVNFNDIIDYQKKSHPTLLIRYIDSIRSIELAPSCELIVTSYSSLAEEALYYSVQSVRVSGLNELPQFDFEDRIPSFFDSRSFTNWFEKKSTDKKFIKKNIKKISREYFHQSAYSTNQLFWDSLKDIVKKNGYRN